MRVKADVSDFVAQPTKAQAPVVRCAALRDVPHLSIALLRSDATQRSTGAGA